MKIEVLVPTYNKTKSQCLDLATFLNIKGPCVISNQNGGEILETINDLKYIESSTKGIGKNRESLLLNASGDYLILIDDDTPLRGDYTEIVESELKRLNFPDVVYFGRISYSKVFTDIKFKNRKVRFFKNISSIGAPGVVVSRNFLIKNHIHFTDKLGVPNYTYLGEDSFFNYCCFKKSNNLFTSSKQILFLKDNESSYFEGYDERYYFSHGYLYKILYGNFAFLYCVRFAIKNNKGNLCFIKRLKALMNGTSKFSKSDKKYFRSFYE